MILPSEETTTDLELVLRIPGPWKSAAALQAALPAEMTLQGNQLVMPGGTRFEWAAGPLDDEFPEIYASSCDQDPRGEHVRQIQRAKVLFGLIGAAGGTEEVCRVIEAAAALIRVGGYGVFIDNSGRAHTAEDWLVLSDNTHDPDALTFGFVNLVKTGTEIFTVGMHVFGHHEIAVVGGDPKADSIFIGRLLAAILTRKTTLNGDELFRDDQAGLFRVSKGTCGLASTSSPMHNPFGAWRLTRA